MSAEPRLGSTDSTLMPYGLTCEQRVTPLGLGESTPRFSWKLLDARRGAAQTAYQICVAHCADDLDDPDRLLWTTGRRTSVDTVLVPFAGPRLQSTMRYHWRVTVWDHEERQGGTAQSWFEMGLLHENEWSARWIGRDTVDAPIQPPQDHDLTPATWLATPPAYLRRTFTLSSAPVRARVYATARGIYELRLNGERVGDAELTPGWTEYHQRVMYQTFDVTSALLIGDNTIGGILADGWWAGYIGFDARRPAMHYGRAPQFLAQLIVEFADGTRQVIATDESWEERPGELRVADLLMGEYADARQRLHGWDQPNKGGNGFRAAAVLDDDVSVLQADMDEPVRVMRELPALSVVERAPGRYIVDLGQNMVGRVRLGIRNALRGQRIQLRHAEMLEDGELHVENLRRAEAIDVYNAGGAELEVFEPRFTFHGFRYVEVSNYPGVLQPGDVVGRVLHSDTAAVGAFACSSPAVNRLQANIEWGQRGNFVYVPTDCPQRDERLGWLGDAQVFAPTAIRNADVGAFMARWMVDVAAGQSVDGAFRDVAPALLLDAEAAPAWGDAGVLIPWVLYRAYGDRRVLERSYATMVGWVEHIRRHNPSLLWRKRVGGNYGDWLQVDVETPRDVLATAYFARSAQVLAEVAEVLGHSADAAEYKSLHSDIRDAFIDAFVDDLGRVEGHTQTGYLLALGFGLLPPEKVVAALDWLCRDIEARDRHLTTGFVGVSLLCPVLSDHGRSDLAYALLLQDSYPSWGYSIRQGATTIWERWDGWTEHAGFQSAAMNSFNHYSLGSVGDWLYGRVAGIDQQAGSVAWADLLLRPTIGGDLTWARATQETPRGLVSCGWRLSDGQVCVDVQIPPGVRTTLHLPTSDLGSVREGAVALADAAGVTVSAHCSAAVVVELAAGRYAFSAAAENSPGTTKVHAGAGGHCPSSDTDSLFQ